MTIAWAPAYTLATGVENGIIDVVGAEVERETRKAEWILSSETVVDAACASRGYSAEGLALGYFRLQPWSGPDPSRRAAK